MSLVTTAEVIAQVSVGVDGETLQSIIDREEAWLASRVGPLDGERTQPVWPGSEPYIRLLRPTDAVTIAGLTSDQIYLSPDGWFVATTFWPASPVGLVYTPIDQLEVKQTVIELCRITLTNSPYQTESADVHSYGRGASPAALRDALAKRLLRPPGSGGLMYTTVPFHGITPVPVEPS